jgi:hypothetical protein
MIMAKRTAQIFGGILILFLGMSGTALADALKYDIYAGGLKVMQAKMDLGLDEKSYEISLATQTQNFIGKLFPWKGTYSTLGHIGAGGNPVPSLAKSESIWRDNASRKTMEYDGTGKLKKLTNVSNGKTTEKTDTAAYLSADAVDLMTGLAMVMKNTEKTGKCAGSFPIFDGKRRFDLTFQDAGMDKLKKTTYSAFSGDALRCVIKVVPVRGFRKKDLNRGWLAVQNHTEERGKPVTLWLAKLANGRVAGVRMEIASNFGTVIAHMTDYPGKPGKKSAKE